jgi:hypothetical protein
MPAEVKMTIDERRKYLLRMRLRYVQAPRGRTEPAAGRDGTSDGTASQELDAVDESRAGAPRAARASGAAATVPKWTMRSGWLPRRWITSAPSG